MKRLILIITSAAAVCCAPKAEPGLKDAFQDKFLVGVALNEGQIRHLDAKADSVIALHFNAIEPENCLKSESVHPEKDRYEWELADKYVDYGTQAGLEVYGHVLIWHSQLSPWFCVDEEGNDVSPEELKARMKDHITTVMTRYKGRIKGWDVVNEAIEDDGSWRQSPFYRILGEEFIPLAFQYAHEADPDCELYYNDYGQHHAGRHARVMELVKMLKDRGLRIDAVGFQGHCGMDYPPVDTLERYMQEVASLGVGICVTEWDQQIMPTLTMSADIADMYGSSSFTELSANPDFAQRMKALLDPYPDGIPASVREQWNDKAEEFWDMLARNSDIIRRVNVWGLIDTQSWKYGWPVPTRKDEPLLFDGQYRAKPVVDRLIDKYL